MHLHDETRDQARAQRSYDRLIAQHPRTLEADDARAQIETIANQVVPAAELSAAELALALRFVQLLAATPAPTLQRAQCSETTLRASSGSRPSSLPTTRACWEIVRHGSIRCTGPATPEDVNARSIP